MNRRELLIGSAATALTRSIGAQNPPAAFTGLSGRPPREQRRFSSVAIERVIAEVHNTIRSPEVAQLFENCFPNTLDTTVFPGTSNGAPDTYVITGDIDAMWLRDSAAQVWPYLPFTKEDPALRDLIEGVIRRQARCILLDSYANAFTRNVSDPPLSWAVHDKTEMRPGVAERKWEIDSLCYTVRLAHGFWKATGFRSPFDAQWMQAAKRIVATFREQQRISNPGPYSFQRVTAQATDTLDLGGYGNPVRPNGLICSAFRPSDDACIYPFFIPANLFAATALEQIAAISTDVYSDAHFAAECSAFAQQVRAAVMQHGIVVHPQHGRIFAYEVDGFGNTLAMDDANAPGLLSLAYLRVVTVDDPLYRSSRAFALSADNPYFFRGAAGEGIGGPHVGMNYVWPMSIIMRALTSTSDTEIMECLQTLVKATAGTGFMHEAFNKNDARKYTRPWFAWANGLFGELVLRLHTEKPELLRAFQLRS